MRKFKKGDLIKIGDNFGVISSITYSSNTRCVLKTSDNITYCVKVSSIILVQPSEIQSFKQYCDSMLKKYVCSEKKCVNWKVCAKDNFSDCVKNKYFSD